MWAFGRVCKELDLCLLRIDCRRHVIELEVKHYTMAIIGRNTSAPGNALLKRYCDKFDNIRPVINYCSLVTFNWLEEGTVLHKKATDTLLLVKKLLDENKFARGDYLELSKLVHIYLTGEK